MTGPGDAAPGGPTPEEDALAGLSAPSDLTEAESREVGEIVGRLGDENISKSERAQQMVRLAGIVGARTRRAGGRAVASGKVLADLLIDSLPHIPVRDLATLTEHHKGLTGEALADALVRNAARTTGGIGAAGGAVAAAEWATLPLLVTVPLEVVVETVAVAAVEVKMVAELHAVYGVDIPGTGTQRATAFAGSWATRRGLDPMKPWTIPNVLGIAGRQQLGKRMIGRFARNLGTIIPFLVGAVVGATVNSSETKKLAVELRTDLRRVEAERIYPAT
ncbi:MAG TPA: hypothetical protein VFL59_07415 [Candidatus Nanopelagicales bacterium]|nr:hypothetical protein [Candidatus Nanopelagicales bacterium]